MVINLKLGPFCLHEPYPCYIGMGIFFLSLFPLGIVFLSHFLLIGKICMQTNVRFINHDLKLSSVVQRF